MKLKSYALRASLLLSLIAAAGCKATGESTKLKEVLPTAENELQEGAYYFMYGDFGSLSLDGMNRMTQPWRIMNAALLKEWKPEGTSTRHEDIRENFEYYGGMIYPDAVGNLPSGARLAKQSDAPIGIVEGIIENKMLAVSGASIGCATCHAGRVYDRNGYATNTVWLGLPNTSLNAETYTQTVYESLEGVTRSSKDWKNLIKYYERLFPEASDKEISTLKIMSGQLRRDFRKFVNGSKRLSPYLIGVPGMTNGIGALKTQLGELSKYGYSHDEVGLTSIPVLTDRQFRSSLLVDGIYATSTTPPFYQIDQSNFGNPDHLVDLAKIVTVFLIPTMGNTAEQLQAQLPKVTKAAKFIAQIRMPPFPAEINETRAEHGRSVFANRCSSCHGTYEGELRQLRLTSFPNKLIPQEKIGTDPVRLQRATESSIQKLMQTKAGNLMKAKPQQGYVAPILTGLWTSAPYLHNNSVPTLWHLLTPTERPSKFYVGGHRLDYVKMGVLGEMMDQDGGTYMYPVGYAPFSEPYLYDVSKLGHSNRGHESQSQGLSDEDKLSLIEFLKLI